MGEMPVLEDGIYYPHNFFHLSPGSSRATAQKPKGAWPRTAVVLRGKQSKAKEVKYSLYYGSGARALLI